MEVATTDRTASGCCTCEVPKGEVSLQAPSGRFHRPTGARGTQRRAAQLRAAVKLGWDVILQGRCEGCGHLPALPTGAKCSDCVHVRRCVTIFGEHPDSRSCQFWPPRFSRAPAGRNDLERLLDGLVGGRS